MRLISNGQQLIASPRNHLAAKFAGNFALGMLACYPASFFFTVPASAFQVGYIIWTYSGRSAPVLSLSAVFAAMVFIWSGHYLLGRTSISLLTRFAAKCGISTQKEALTPIFLGTTMLLAWATWQFTYAFGWTWMGSVISNIFVIGGVSSFILGQQHRMKKLRNNPEAETVKIETTKKKSPEKTSGELVDRLLALQTAENFDHLEQLSRDCLAVLKPVNTPTVDCTSKLVDELMKRKLNKEADDLSALQLKLIDQ
ncbi:MAG: hypothetical protein SGJ27_19920 [Candidatus Melainabacteria bacterium]|nr:hypothetical protein [Candidatus Melainabacteria bacterium]